MHYNDKNNVWPGILNRILGHFFMNKILTSEIYLALLRNNIIPTIVGDAFGNIWFQQDEEPPHYY